MSGGGARLESSVVDPRHFYTDPAPDPAIFFSDLQDGNKNLFSSKFFCLLLFHGIYLHHFSKIKKS